MNNCLNINNIDCFLYSLNEIIFEKCFVDIIHSVVVADIALRWYTKIIIFKKRPFTFHNALQAAFSLRVGTSQGVALYRAVEYCGIPASFTFHNALFIGISG